MTQTQSPIRHPDQSSGSEMTARGWVLVVANIVLPGLAQVLAGNRKLGRFGLLATLLLAAMAASAGVLWLMNPAALLALAASATVMLVLQLVSIGYLMLWIVLTLDTLRLVRLIKTKPGHRWWIAGVALTVLLALSLAGGYAASVADAHRRLLEGVFGQGHVAEPISGRYNILILGGDSGDDRFGMRPDSISVLSFDAESGKTSLIGVPRNLEQAQFADGSPLWEVFPGGYNCGRECLISYLNTYATEHPELYPDAEQRGSTPGIEATRDAVSGVLGLELQYYVLVDMAGFESLIDALGGVTIEVAEDVPIASFADEYGNLLDLQGWIEAGVQQMDGKTALWYARSRVLTNDYDRMLRQRQLQEALIMQFTPEKLAAGYGAFADAVASTVKTDIPAGLLPQLIDIAFKAKEQPISRLDIAPPLINTAHPDFGLIRSKVAEVLE